MRSLDYVLDNNDNFWIVHKIYKNIPYGRMVFQVDNVGRYNKITKKYYKKVINDNGDVEFLIKNIKKVFYPALFYKENKVCLPKEWKLLSDLLLKIGIKEQNIGIFGSYLIGFDVEHDIDYVVYGKDSYELIKNNIDYIHQYLKVTSITNHHIDYQCKKYKHLYNEQNDLSKIISHNWAGLQFREGVLSTIRFIKKTNHYINMEGIEKTIKGIVLDDVGTNFLPRIGKIKMDEGIIKVITYFWMFNAFLKKGEKILIKGLYNKKKKELYLINKDHWIKYL